MTTNPQAALIAAITDANRLLNTDPYKRAEEYLAWLDQKDAERNPEIRSLADGSLWT